MLVQMKIDVTEHNKKSDFHGTTEVLDIRTENGEEFQCVTTYADIKHEWWKSLYDEAEDDTFAVDCIEEVQRGVWMTLGGNFRRNIESSSNVVLLDAYPNVTRHGESVSDEDAFGYYQNLVSCYMVCDSVEQAVEYWKGAIETKDEQYVIALTPILKQGEPAEGGWRWEKWGNYIGTQNQQCVYLVDEPEINKVYCAHIYKVQEI